MNKNRIEAFSDGVIAIIITIMVLELKIPRGVTPEAFLPVVPTLLSYLLSFIFIAIYWNNHHHLFQAVKHINGRTLWANLHLLFWLTLIPFVTAWMGENRFTTWPVVFYGANLLMAGTAYYILSRNLLTIHGKDSVLSAALGTDVKSRLSLIIYVIALVLAFYDALWACALYVVVAVMWLIPDRRIERTIAA
ncbi:MAG TPA: TMEM175 family protein [Bacteroidota bacterium]|nr:TMEM175 family protein [Bacteroidota bacterium]